MTDQTINVEVEIDEEYREGVEAITYMLAMNKEIIENSHLFTKEEVLEAFTQFNEIMEIVFVAGMLTIETKVLINEVEGTEQ